MEPIPKRMAAILLPRHRKLFLTVTGSEHPWVPRCLLQSQAICFFLGTMWYQLLLSLFGHSVMSDSL